MSDLDFGSSRILYPRIPKRVAKGEDVTTPRICVGISIMDCINALDIYVDAYDEPCTRFVYDAHVLMRDLIQPDTELVSDAWQTREFWILRPQLFHRIGKYVIRRQIEFPGSAYSRYTCTLEGFTEVAAENEGRMIYGTPDAFGFIGYDVDRNDGAVQYLKDHPEMILK